MAKVVKKRKGDKGKMPKAHREAISRGMKASKLVKVAAKIRGIKLKGTKYKKRK